MNELLNDSHWNSLRIFTLALDIRRRKAQAWLDGLEEKGMFYIRRLSISKENWQEARRQIEQALNLLAALGSKLELRVKQEMVNSELRGEFSVSWANLLEIPSLTRLWSFLTELLPRLAD